MIISTDKSSTMLKRSVGKDKSVVIAADKMFEQFVLDPTMTQPIRDAYIVTNEDISAKRLKDRFEQALTTKHPATKVIFINKSSRPLYQDGFPGLDCVLQKPKPDDITKAISDVISANTVSSTAGMTYQEHIDIPDFNPEDTATYKEPIVEEPIVEEPISEPEPELPVPEPEPEPEPAPVYTESKSEIIDRIKHAESVKDVSVITREITAVNLLKDLAKSNSTYAGIEEKLKSLNDVIFGIINDTSIKSLDDKLSKVHAVLHDKAFFHAQGDTLIEQRVEEVIDLICTQTASLLHSRLSEIDAAIRKSYTDKDVEMQNARLAGLNEKRANLILELTTLEQEINNIFEATDLIAIDSAAVLSQGAEDLTGNDAINDMLRARGTYPKSSETVDAIKAIIELSGDKVPDTFKELKRDVVNMVSLLRRLFDIDQEVIAAQQAIINFLKSNKVEDTVVAETLLKKSLRVYIAEEGTGKSIITYLLSKYKSRQNANVLLIDLTGSAKYEQYNIPYTNVDTYLNELQQREFMVAAGTIDNSIASAQRVVTTLYKAADYYRVINIVLTTEQRELFETIAQDVLSVNFIVDTNLPRITRMKEIISKSKFENVARRVIINKCDVPIRTIVTKLGLDDTIDIQICTVPTVNVITDAGLNGYDPYGNSAVDLVMEEVIKHA